MNTRCWIDTACDLLLNRQDIVRVTVAQVRGSSPREPGATMLVSRDAQHGTIGGGQLEWQATEQARRLLAGDAPPVTVTPLRLGPDLAQCCGGEVVLWLERISAVARPELCGLQQARQPDGSLAIRTRWQDGAVRHEPVSAPRAWQQDCLLRRNGEAAELWERWLAPARGLWIFGAGHVGHAVVKLLEDLPQFNIRWIDSRAAQLQVPHAPHLRVDCVAEPVEVIHTAPPGTSFLVLTHDHELDYQICAAVLARGDALWLGLIGSKSKAARFRSRLRRDGFTDSRIATLICPVGLPAIDSKLPAAIAVGIVAQLLSMAPAPATQAASTAANCDPDCRRCQTQPVALER